MFLFLIVILIIVIFFGVISLKSDLDKGNSFFENLSESFSNKYEELEVGDNIDIIKLDFGKILAYHNSVIKNYVIFRDDDEYYGEILKFNINGKESFLGYYEEYEKNREYILVKRHTDLFVKIDIDKRFCISSQDVFFKKDKSIFEKRFKDTKEHTLTFDSKYFSKLKKELSEEFYNSNFREIQKSEYLEIDDATKAKLLNLVNGDKFDLKISLKDRLLVIEIIGNSDYINKNIVEATNSIERIFTEVLDIFFDIEKNYKNKRYSRDKVLYSNIKNIILDLDNTIIRDENEDSEFLREVLTNNGYDENDFFMLFESLVRYDSSKTEENSFYDKQEMLNFINEDLDRNYTIELIDEVIDNIGNYWIDRIMLKEEVIRNLSQKYNLYVYSNFFQQAQEMRLENIGYMKYIKKVFGGDKYGVKPYKKSLKKILEEINAIPSECIMIGDTKSKDILAANNVGMKSILLGNSDNSEDNDINVTNYLTVEDINDIELILL